MAAQCVFIAVGPSQLPTVAREVAGAFLAPAVVAVCCAGLHTARLRALFPETNVVHATSLKPMQLRAQLGLGSDPPDLRWAKPHGDKFASPATGDGGRRPEASIAQETMAVQAGPELVNSQIKALQLAAGHVTTEWVMDLAVSLDTAVRALDISAVDRRTVCARAVAGPNAREKDMGFDVAAIADAALADDESAREGPSGGAATTPGHLGPAKVRPRGTREKARRELLVATQRAVETLGQALHVGVSY